VGHLYFFLDVIYPATSGRRLLKTPRFLYDILPPHYNQYAMRNERPQDEAQPGHRWGRGYRLGGAE
jgi:CRISPR/Cas system CMR subunit Cmr6 (Cas7 group RAMP superfamily)